MLTHHAYYIEDSPLNWQAYQDGIRASVQMEPHDPNFVARQYEKFGIDEARDLQNLAGLKATGGTALFFIATSSITSEAQQALLKLFEEPQPGVFFILLVPHGVLLPTLRSRCLVYPGSAAPAPHAPSASDQSRASQAQPPQALAQKFLAAPYKTRSEMVTALLKEEEWAKERARGLLNALEALLAERIQDKEAREGLADIAHFRQYLADRSPSLKMILEHFAATLPRQ